MRRVILLSVVLLAGLGCSRISRLGPDARAQTPAPDTHLVGRWIASVPAPRSSVQIGSRTSRYLLILNLRSDGTFTGAMGLGMEGLWTWNGDLLVLRTAKIGGEPVSTGVDPSMPQDAGFMSMDTTHNFPIPLSVADDEQTLILSTQGQTIRFHKQSD